MQELVSNFGIQPVLLAAQIVNFLIIFWLLKRYAYKPIFSVLKKRQEMIAEGVKNAEASQKVLDKSLEEEKALLKKAQQQAQELLSDAQRQASETITAAEENAKVRVEKMLEDGAKAIEQQTIEAEERLAAHTTKLAIELLEKSLDGLVDTKTQKDVVSKMAKRLKTQ